MPKTTIKKVVIQMENECFKLTPFLFVTIGI